MNPLRKGKLLLWTLVLAIAVGAILYAGLVPPRNAAAVVNGQVITRAQYNDRFNTIKTAYVHQGGSVSDPALLSQIKDQAIQGIVAETLVLQAAKKEGITTDPAQVNARLRAMESGFSNEQAFAQSLAADGLSVAAVKENITTQLITDAYAQKHIPPAQLAVSDADVEALYQDLSKQESNLPSLDAIRPTLEAQITQEKIDNAMISIVAKLKQQGSVAIYI